ncbi:cytochrome c oxidase accessory protein CcoG [Pseudohongiella spirulinae]|uniref:Polyferredoxin n=1 Tax=Pseudohongiella spirulinae TaxID=1249552 RepID=A0A0S2KGG3_9GAMM|nr:cytochrome c oxidase accessory protein CcoG [Pseudohongiella spirulinae]ALO47203.1 Polyferredoxin [Pseudohongiella spirulinae]
MQKIPTQEIRPDNLDSRVFNLYEKREKIYTRGVEGFFQRIRLLTGWPLLLGYFLLPWINIDGRQAVLFDLPARQFHILWLTFWPQDFVLLGWLLAIAAFALFFVTTLWGRVWCGYTCPQTVWTAIFMWAEQFAEGERNQRIKLDKVPSILTPRGWNKAGLIKTWKRLLKHSMWLGFAALTGITFIGYFYGIRDLVIDSISWQLPLVAASWVVFFTLATYINAGWMREQVCIYMCPYARFQSVMFDRDTLVISYDESRGEQRGPRRRDADYKKEGLGDCIDCTMCVQVCPTGIDIRDGLQYQCIGCAACIDACDDIMEKMHYPKGLISYTTQNKLAGGSWTWKRPKLIGYGAALLVMTLLFATALWLRVPLNTEVIRDRGVLYQELANGNIENVFTLRIINMDRQAQTFQVSLNGLSDATLLPGNQFDVEAGEIRDVLLRVQAPASALSGSNQLIEFLVESADQRLRSSSESRFLGPQPVPTRGTSP